ncbi:unnamed protein product [Spirodela intermedia]|uniref:Uncharacterized protein n=1 Tax=Spirodela intermedia TaxID=51605 RepID=A0A7I8JIU2_SPIIN|nr:unnamed protein product [Spirodela intermedia]CAA6670030.1 unnamed protein product [Spirodela intermedia]
MTSAQDPFYIVKEEIQESVRFLSSMETIPSNTGEYVHLTRELLGSCESIEWQVVELDKAITVAAKDPAYYHIDEVELDKRSRWTSNARNQVSTVKKALDVARDRSKLLVSSTDGKHREMMRLPNDIHLGGKSNSYEGEDNDDFISSESDRQSLLIKCCFPLSIDDSFSAFQIIEEIAFYSCQCSKNWRHWLTIHEELIGQDKILEDLNSEMETTSNRLDFVQKKVAMVMKKASAKGQFMMILFLIVLCIVLFVLVFFT